MLMFLRCIGEAVAAKGLKGLAGLMPFGEFLYEIAEGTIERYRQQQMESQLRQHAEQAVRASEQEVRESAQQISQELLSDQTSEVQDRLEQYLRQVPAVARQSLKRPDDPSGTTLPADMSLLNPVQLGNLLPRRLPLFQAGEQVPHSPQWRFVELLGAGGFGEVWLARHTFLEESRAYKFCLDPAARDRLLRYEGEVVRQVMRASRGMPNDQHGIVPLVDAYLDGETPWLAYEYIDGGNLSTVVRRQAGLSPEQRGQRSLQYLIALARVVGHFHRLPQPIIHRDLKPANILLKRVDKSLLLRVTDFGISHVQAEREIQQATLSTPQMSLGQTFRGAHTPIYASPQQKRGMKPNVRDDVYALGVIGWQLLLGDLGAERPAGRWRKRLADCQLGDAVLELLESCWDDDPNERPADAGVLAEELRKASGRSKAPVSSVLLEKVRQDFQSWLDWGKTGTGTRPWLEQHQGSVEDWKKAATLNQPEAMILLGDCHEEGIGVSKDYAEAMRWYRKAADAGDGTAMNCIGWLYHNGWGVSQDYAEAMRWYRKAADAGDGTAMNCIGWLYHNGWGVSQDYAEAMRWYRKGADAGSGTAMCNIGWLYLNGWGVSQDYAESMQWFRKAADGGNGTAMNRIGWLYENGLGVSQDYSEAMQWYCKAADAGSGTAMYNIGSLYANGQGVVQNYFVAMKWYRKAADAGDGAAMNWIGWLFQHGLGVAKSKEEARRWYQLAVEHGHEAAEDALNCL